ncbi:MAG: M3 family metallopeptidase [Anaerolineae bacterium]|nr:M3 family metallopeptidase [Gloeobacterales cyanobacterium ES-bin-313]
MKRRDFLAATIAITAVNLKPAFAVPSENSLLATWRDIHGGLPPFDQAKVEQFKPALLEGMDGTRKEIAAIAANPAPPTFENTLAALEDAGRPFDRVNAVFGVFTSTMNDKPMQSVQKEMVGPIAAFGDEITQNEALFTRIKSVYENRTTAKLTPEQKRLTEVTYERFARQGAALNKTQKARLTEINQGLAKLYTRFSQNGLADEENYTIILNSVEDLAGLSETLKDSAAAAAEEKGMKGKWLISNTRSSVEPFLTFSSRRDLREKAWRMWISRGENGGEHDNNAVITEILQLRAEKAQLLGFPTYAHWITKSNMAKTPDAAMDLMLRVWKPAVARVREEVADMQKVADAEGATFKIAPWDYRYYSEKVRKDRYGLDQNEVKSYLQLEKILEAMHWAAGQLYGLSFVRLIDVPVVMPDVRVWEVRRGEKRIGLWYFDPYARSGKLSGAWMSEYRLQEAFRDKITPIVSNNCNFVKAKPGEPVLISWDDASTMFHEFGHALHGLNSNVHYPSLSCTNVARDFVEFPSQLNEYWLPTEAVLNRFAVHYQTGKVIPKELVAKIKKAKTFNQGFKTVEYLASAIVDMKVHLAGSTKIDPKTFEAQTLKAIGMPDEIVMRHRMPHFGHIFSGDGYSAGYYDYIWADTLTADAAEVFQEAPGGFYDKPTAKRLYESIMSVGNTIEAAEAFRRFRGRDVSVNALMRDRGFPTV